MPTHDTVELECLAAQGRWVRRLALDLARNVHDAEDIAQETWLAALRRGPIEEGALASWCSGVVRNLVRFRSRTDANRAARELRTARTTIVESPAAALERLEARELLLQAVRELHEPYRSTVLLRWFDELEPAEIARRTGVPLRTVHTRLRRAVQLLRERLDRSTQGGRATWVSAFAPLLAQSPRTWALVSIMNAKVGVGIGATVIAILAAAWLFPMLHPTSPDQPAQVGSAGTGEPVLAGASTGKSPVILEPGNRTPVVAAPSGQSPTQAAPTQFIEGLVIDAQGEAVANVDLQFRSSTRTGDSAIVQSNSAGEFRIPETTMNGSIVAASESWATILSPRVLHPYPGQRHVLVVAPRISLDGVVVDEHRNPIPDVSVSHIAPDLRTQLDFVLDSSASMGVTTRTDAQGRFHLDAVAAIDGAVLRAVDELLRFAGDVRAAPMVPRADLEIVLKLLDPNLRLQGRVVDAHRTGVAGAWVGFGKQSVLTDSGGEFRLDLRGDDRTRTIRVAKQGLLPVELECTATSTRGPGAWPDPLVIVLDRESLAITGRVLDQGGVTVPGARVVPLDRTPFGQVYLAEATAPEGLPRWGPEDVEALLAGKLFNFECIAGEDGSFELPGLLPKSYRMLVFDPVSKALLVTEPVLAGTKDLEVRLPNAERRARVAGHVVDRKGRPVEGARVEPSRQLPDVPAYALRNLSGVPARTDASGAFELRGLPLEVDRLIVRLDPSPTKTTALITPGQDPETMEIVIPRPCHLRVDLTSSKLNATSLEVQDATGGSLSILSRRGTSEIAISAGRRGGPQRHFLALQGRRSEAFAVDETAEMLLLFDANGEAARIPLNLAPDTLNVIRP